MPACHRAALHVDHACLPRCACARAEAERRCARHGCAALELQTWTLPAPSATSTAAWARGRAPSLGTPVLQPRMHIVWAPILCALLDVLSSTARGLMRLVRACLIQTHTDVCARAAWAQVGEGRVGVRGGRRAAVQHAGREGRLRAARAAAQERVCAQPGAAGVASLCHGHHHIQSSTFSSAACQMLHMSTCCACYHTTPHYTTPHFHCLAGLAFTTPHHTAQHSTAQHYTTQAGQHQQSAPRHCDHVQVLADAGERLGELSPFALPPDV